MHRAARLCADVFDNRFRIAVLVRWTVHNACLPVTCVDLITTPLRGIDATKIVVDFFGNFSSNSLFLFLWFYTLLCKFTVAESIADHQATTSGMNDAPLKLTTRPYHFKTIVCRPCLVGVQWFTTMTAADCQRRCFHPSWYSCWVL